MYPRALTSFCLLLVLVTLTNFVALSAKLSLTTPSAGEIVISVDPSLHQEFGLAYPVTYKLSIPAGSAGLVAYCKYQQGASWVQLPQKTSGDFFNGEQVVRFDYAASAAYVSVGFDASSDDIFLRITDGSGQPVPIQFQQICRYYDNRKSVVTLSADDWKEYTNLAFVQSVHTLRTYNLPVTVGIITGGCTANTWQTIQAELDSGLVEAASHTRTHVDPPYPDPVSEIIGSKQDILANLTLPAAYRKGSDQYVYTWIAPFGSTTTETEAVVGQARYIIDRMTFASTGGFTAWDGGQRRYTRDGKTAEMGPLWGGFTDAPTLNNLFNQSLAGGSIYHLMLHPLVLADSSLWLKPDLTQHLAYISNRPNVWYVNFGPLYIYHLLQDDAAGTVQIVGGPPLIVTQPAGETGMQGGTATFSVAATGSAPLSYQWQRNGVDIPGATAALYTTPVLTQTDSGAVFHCLVSNSLGSVTSNDAVLSVVPYVINALANGSFESGTTSWTFYTNGSATFTQASIGSSGTRSARVSIASEGTNVQLYQAYITLQPNTNYRITFDAYSTTGHDLEVNLGQHTSPYLNYGLAARNCDLGTSWQNYTINFTTSGFSNPVSDGRLMFWLAPYDAAGDDYYIDNVVLARVSDLNPPVVSPQITVHPVAQTVTAGQAATFSVGATGTAPLAYQWQKNYADIVGATNSFYTTPSTTSADSGALYRCRVTNSGGSVTSADAALSVITPRPAKFTAQPRDTTVAEGRAAGFSVTATGDAPLVYQWERDGVNVAGGSTQSYSLALVSRADSGATFRCIVSNGIGKDTSVTVMLKVLAIPPAITVQPVAQTVNAGQTATFSLTAVGTAPLTYQWQKDTINIPEATDSAYTTPATSSADSGTVFRCVVRNIAGSITSAATRLTVVTPRPAEIVLGPRDTTVLDGHSAQFTVTAIGTLPMTYQWQRNGIDIAGAGASTYALQAAARSDSGATFRCVVANSIGKDTSDAANLHVLSAPPVITLQPVSKTLNAGQTASFAIHVTGTTPLTYQWQRDTVDIPGAVDSIYTTPAVTSADSGALYRCRVANGAGSIMSTAAQLTVVTPYPAVVTVDPRDTTVTDGHAAAFTVTAAGTAPISYRWQKNGGDIAGATAASYLISAATLADSGAAFRCVVSNSTGNDTCSTAILRVQPVPPAITVEPASQSVLAGYTASFSLTATGSEKLGYQWQKDGMPISGATSATYTTPATSLSDNGSGFRCLVFNRAGSATSQDAVLTVSSPPVIVNAAANGTFESGTTAWTFYTNGAGTPSTVTPGSSGSGNAMQLAIATEGTNVQLYQAGITLQANTSYQLSFDAYSTTGHDVDVSIGQHSSPYANYGLTSKKFDLSSTWQSYSVTFTTSGFSGNATDARLMFWMAPYDAAGDRYYFDNIQLAKTSDLAPTPPSITLQPAAQSVTAGETATFSLTATGTAPLSYQWQRNSIDISGATGPSYATAAVTRADSGAYYRCRVTNVAASVYSATVQLTVITPQPPVVTLDPHDTTVAEGHPAQFSITASGSTPITYQWQKNGTDISGATATSYSIAAAVRTDSGATFRCIASGSGGKDTSAAARLSVLAVPPAIATQPANQIVTTGQTATFSVAATGSAPLSYQWQKDNADINGATNVSYTSPAVTVADSGALYRCRVANNVGSVFSAAAVLSVMSPQAPLVTVDPHDTTAADGTAASFAVAATGSVPLTYQWQKNGANISGATSTSYSIASAARSDSGAAFRCIVSNTIGKDTSAAALLKVLAVSPTITTQPLAQTVTVGQMATFSVAASGTAPLSYQWQKNGAPISGATGASYTTPATVASDSGAMFRCVITNSANSVTSQAALLTVNSAPVVVPNAVANGTFESGTTGWTFYSNGAASSQTSSPGSSGSGVAMLVAVTTEGTNVQLYQSGITLQPNTSYQLSFNAYSSTGHDLEISLGQHGSPYANYGLANRAFNLTTGWQNFSVTFTTSGFSATVSDARLMFWLAPYDAAGDKYYFDDVQLARTSDLAPAAPSVTTQPVAQTVTAGQTATFSIAAVGTAPLAYQWQRNSADISNATSSSYTTPATSSADSGASFRCRVSNSAGSTYSNSARLFVVTPVPAVVILDPRDTTVVEGSVATFSISTTGSAPLSYQWQKNGTNISNATSFSFSTGATVHGDSGATFRCIVSNSAGKDTSAAAILRVTPSPPVIATQPTNVAVLVGQAAVFTVAASGSAPLSYQWQKNDMPISGATSASYTTPATVAADSGSIFRCVVTNSAGSVTSQAAVLSVSATAANLLSNGTFENGTTGWSFYTNGSGSFTTVSPGSSGAGKALQLAIAAEGTNVQLYQFGIALRSNTSYQLSFNAYSSTGHDLEISLGQHGSPYANYGLANRAFNLTTGWQNFSVTFTTSGFSATVSDARLMFWLAPYDAAGDQYYLDNVVLSPTLAMKDAPEGEPLPPLLASIVPAEFVLEGNFPNPFNPSTVIRYGLPEPATVSIVVYSILGQEVARLRDGYQSAGTYQVTWEGRGIAGGALSSGVYLCRMVATNAGSGRSFVATKRMILMK